MQRILLSLTATILVSLVWGQSYVSVANQYGISVPTGAPQHGCGVSCYDFNNDGLDDLTFGTDCNGIHLYVNTGDGFELYTVLPCNGQTTALIWADYDDDGDRDLFAGVYGGISQFWKQENATFENVSEDVGIPQEQGALTCGASWVDYDMDGDLDLYICNYNWGDGQGNWMLTNTDGQFSETEMNNGMTDDDYPTFMSAFADFDQDLLPDLYLINDKDPPNQLFRNNGDGTFSDLSASSQTDIVADAMSNSICDYDHDGDLDIYVANNYLGNFFLENQGDFLFEDVTEEQSLSVDLFCWGSLWMDYDNNSWDDLFITTTSPLNNNANPVFRNNNGNGFSPLNGIFQFPNNTVSAVNAKGDFNDDGFPDFIQFNYAPSNVSVWQNLAGNNHWLGVDLIPTVSNPEAIGTWVTCNYGFQQLKSFTLSSDNFMSQNGRRVVFGLGLQTNVDYLKIDWPSGWTDLIETPEIDKYIAVTEGQTFQVPIDFPGDLVLCPGDSIVLDAGDFETVTWSDGSSGRYKAVFEPQSISATVLTPYGFMATSDPVVIQMATPPVGSFEVIPPSCFGYDDGNATMSFGTPVTIEDVVSLVHNLSGLSAGAYPLLLTDNWGCAFTDTLFVPEPAPLEHLVVSQEDPLCFGESNGSIEIDVSGGTGDYFFLPPQEDWNAFSAGSDTLWVSDENGCLLGVPFTLSEPLPLIAALSIAHASPGQAGSCAISLEGGVPPYSISWSNGVQGAVNSPLAEGTYAVTVVDANGCILVDDFTIDFIVGTTTTENTILRLFPNPFDTYLSATAPAFFTWQLIDAGGRVVSQGNVDDFPLDTSPLAKGPYQFKMKTTDGTAQVFQLIRK